MSRLRVAFALSMIMLAAIFSPAVALAEDSNSDVAIKGEPTTSNPQSDFNQRLNLWQEWKDPSQLAARIDLPRQMRLSTSRRPLQCVTIVGGDRLIGECLEWQPTSIVFRLLNGQTIIIPRQLISSLTNPPGEIDVIAESFEDASPFAADPKNFERLDRGQSADGEQSLKIVATMPGFRQLLEPPLKASRIEFQFRLDTRDEFLTDTEILFAWQDGEEKSSSIVARLESGGSLSVHGIGLQITKSASLTKLTNEWHSFIAILTSEGGRLIVDQAQICKFTIPQTMRLKLFETRPTSRNSENIVWIDALQVRRLYDRDEQTEAEPLLRESDAVQLASGDLLFGRLVGTPPMIEILNRKYPLLAPNFTGLFWRQPTEPIARGNIDAIPTGLFSTIELQPFSDRPDCSPERVTGAITRCDSENVFINSALLGELKFAWSDIARITPVFFGQSILLDARRFHLGNTQRSDFVRQAPDGVEITFPVTLSSRPQGRSYLSLDAADLEASGPNAPIASPHLAELRRGRLITELIVNDKSVGPLNAQLRFKARAQQPERLRIEIPDSFLRTGTNSIRLRQHPRSDGSKDYDDCEIEKIRLEFEG